MTSYVNVSITVRGFYSNLDTEEKFLLRLKESTIIRIDRLVHLINLYQMTCNYVFIFLKH